jgi:hypothetical protein
MGKKNMNTLEDFVVIVQCLGTAMFYPIVAPHITPMDHELNQIDSPLYQEALV